MEIEGFPDYLIYPDGRVWSKYYKKFLKHKKDERYYRIGLLNDNRERKFKMIHRLIAEHYIPNPDNKPEIDHINRNSFDNRIENLRWVDRKENVENRGIHRLRKDTSSGHKFIGWNNQRKRWRSFNRHFESKIDAICYKYIYLLKIKTIK